MNVVSCGARSTPLSIFVAIAVNLLLIIPLIFKLTSGRGRSVFGEEMLIHVLTDKLLLLKLQCCERGADRRVINKTLRLLLILANSFI